MLRTQPNVTINAIGSQMKVIQAFGPEITGGSPVTPEDVLSSEMKLGAKGRPYYVYDLKVWRPMLRLPVCCFPTAHPQCPQSAQIRVERQLTTAYTRMGCGCRWQRRAICWWWPQCCETAHI